MNTVTPSVKPATAAMAVPVLQVERDFAGRQFIGGRKMQEDFYAFCDVSGPKESPGSRLLVTLGDGLGAHIGGSVASAFMVDEFIKAFRRSTLSTAWRLRVALESANERLYEVSARLSNFENAPMGSTLVGAVVADGAVHWVSVGDSPMFLFRDGIITRLNADHSLSPIIDERMRRGEITQEEALNHPDRHILQSACLGLPLTIVDSQMDPYALMSGDIIIVSSDGILTLGNNQMEEMLTFGKFNTAGKIADSIIFAVRCADQFRQDNVTIAIVKIP